MPQKSRRDTSITYQSVHVQETITKTPLLLAITTHLSASTEQPSSPQAITEGPQSPFSLVQFKKLGEADGVNQIRKGCRSSYTHCLVPLSLQHGLDATASKLLGEGGPQGAQLWETNQAKPLVGTATATTTLQAQHRTLILLPLRLCS